MQNLVIVGNVADNPFVVDVAHYFRQEEDYSDLISLKDFTNTEFCPRFIVDEGDWKNIGRKLQDKTVLLVSTSIGINTRNDLSMRNFLIARAAKDNGAARVILVEPDLYYSAQDRGPRVEQGVTEYKRDRADYKKFDGQPFSARLYADLLKDAGVDIVVTIHNHSYSVTNIFMDRFSGNFHNLQPADVYADYIQTSGVADPDNLIVCAPDKGAISFAHEVQCEMGCPDTPFLIMSKERKGEEVVNLKVSKDSPIQLKDIKDKEVVVIDDMIRTGNTTVECCRLIRTAKPRRIVFFVTHFFASRECRAKLNDPSIDEIVTTNTIPQILNRDMQGRLRNKMVVLKIEPWVAQHVRELLKGEPYSNEKPLYAVDMSSKNPRWRGKMGPLFDVD
jgi:ribose-phosphate pyrophosphokinase